MGATYSLRSARLRKGWNGRWRPARINSADNVFLQISSSSPWVSSHAPGTSELPKGVGEHSNCFRQILDVPGDNLRLCGFPRCSCATLALGPLSVLGAGRSRVLVALVVLVSLPFHGLGEPCAVVLYLIAYKREAPRSKGDISRVSAKGTLMLKSTCSGCTDVGLPLDECHVPFQSGDKRTQAHESIPVHVANTVSVRSSGSGWQKGSNKPVRDDVARATRTDHPDGGPIVVREVLPGPREKKNFVAGAGVDAGGGSPASVAGGEEIAGDGE
ncbi:hypothetical protein TIFTF001_004794 [Ficus carica]|uniref:Uncharacterized protein n=1 Tax=Ficus carica TaxID=3494 RepID=A0AA87ZCY5_FICCA|nr:hypothetical protein TIFTF001_004794 [Ficus carica]